MADTFGVDVDDRSWSLTTGPLLIERRTPIRTVVELADQNAQQEIWHVDGRLHREDGPALVDSRGVSAWCYGGRLHRVNEPAWIGRGSIEYYLNGARHRAGGPAVSYYDATCGILRWYHHGRLHRYDGPAVETFSDLGEDSEGFYRHREEWYWNGVRQRIGDGPALTERFDGAYLLEAWYVQGRLHRVDGPARITRSDDGITIQWYYHDRLHRENAPAVIRREGNNRVREWYRYNLRHREDGPAFISQEEGIYQWYLNGVYYGDHHQGQAIHPMELQYINVVPTKVDSSAISHESICVICQDTLDRPLSKLECGHEFHFHCIKEWISSAPSPTCPTCRYSMTAEDLVEFL